MDGSATTDLSSQEIHDIRAAISIISKWAELKSHGFSAIPAGDAAAAFKRIERTLREHGIYIVPVGELEGFVREVGGHGPEWVNKVLETYPDLSDDIYVQIRQFITEMNL